MKIDELLEIINRQNEEEARLAAIAAEKQKLENAIKTGVPGLRFRRKNFENFIVNDDNRAGYEACLNFARNFDTAEQGVFLSGRNGTGKTHLAAAVANELAKNGRAVIFGNVMTLLSLIKATYNNQSQFTEYDIINAIGGGELIVIDDIDMMLDSGFSQLMIYHIVNNAYEQEKKLIITTRLDFAGLFKKLGEATVSRLAEMCQYVRLNGENFRLKNFAAKELIQVESA